MNMSESETAIAKSQSTSRTRVRRAGYAIAAMSGAIAVYAYVSPWIGVRGLANAIVSADSEKIDEYIDFESLRNDLSEQMKAGITAKYMKEMSDNPFAGLGLVMIPPIVDSVVNQTVTPRGLASLFQSAQVADPEGSGGANANSNIKAKPFEGQNTKLAYTGINQFKIDVSSLEDRNKSIAFALRREGLGKWVMYKAQLSQNFFD